MYLFINTTLLKKVTTALITPKEVFKLEEKCLYNQSSEKLLPLMDKLLKNHKKTLKSFKGIIVVKGHGRFSALRIGVIAANTLAYSLQIPVLGVMKSEAQNRDLKYKDLSKTFAQIKKQAFVEPEYGLEPNITCL